MGAQPQLDDEMLQRLLDGDLNAREAKQARDLIARSEADAARYRSFERLHRLMQVTAEEASEGLDADAMFRNIQAGIERDRPGVLEQLKVWLSEFFEHRSQVWMPLAGAGAVAAAVLLTFYVPGGGQDHPGTEPTVAVTPQGEQGEPAAVVEGADSAPSSEIVQVDFGANTGTVFEIALAGGKSTPVVWINDDSGGGL